MSLLQSHEEDIEQSFATSEESKMRQELEAADEEDRVGDREQSRDDGGEKRGVVRDDPQENPEEIDDIILEGCGVRNEVKENGGSDHDACASPIVPNDESIAEAEVKDPVSRDSSSKDEIQEAEKGIQLQTCTSARSDIITTPGSATEDRKTTANWKSTKHQPEIRSNKPADNTPVKSPAVQKKVTEKVNSLIENYTTKVKNSNTRVDTSADRTPRRGGVGLRKSESENRGHISEMREKIERSASSVAAQSTRTPRLSESTAPGAKEAQLVDGVPLEEKRKKKAEEWLGKVGKSPSSASGTGVRELASPLSKHGKAPTSTWRKREEELKKEREEKEAAQRQLEEKRKKVEEERRIARDAARKQKEQDEATKREQIRKERTSAAAAAAAETSAKGVSQSGVTDKNSRQFQSSSMKSVSPLIKGHEISIEEEKLKKEKILEARIRPLDIEGLDKDELEKKAHELHDKIRQLEEEKYDMEKLLEKRELELNEMKRKTGDTKGKFVKPLLKKVVRNTEESEKTAAAAAAEPSHQLRSKENISEIKILPNAREGEVEIQTKVDLSTFDGSAEPHAVEVKAAIESSRIDATESQAVEPEAPIESPTTDAEAMIISEAN